MSSFSDKKWFFVKFVQSKIYKIRNNSTISVFWAPYFTFFNSSYITFLIYKKFWVNRSPPRAWRRKCLSAKTFDNHVYTHRHIQYRADCNKEFTSFLSPADPKKWPYLELAIFKRNGVCDGRYYAVIICVDYSRTLTTLRLSLSRCELEWVKRI